MQIASRINFWGEAGSPAHPGGKYGTHLEIELNDPTGYHINLIANGVDDEPITVDWGDGTNLETFNNGTRDTNLIHQYPSFPEKYTIIVTGVRTLGFRIYDSMSDYAPYFDAACSFVDYSGRVTEVRSGAFAICKKLTRFIAPNILKCGQGVFRHCSRLSEVKIPLATYFYDQTFMACTSLEEIKIGGGTLWYGVFLDCNNLRTVDLGEIETINRGCFEGCSNLSDVYVMNKTVAQVLNSQPGAKNLLGFPWGANPTTRFHCSDGIVLGDGTRI